MCELLIVANKKNTITVCILGKRLSKIKRTHSRLQRNKANI